MSYENNNKTVISGGTSLSTLLTVAFVVLKLCGVINWSWFWVCSPIIFSVGFFIAVLAIMFLISLIIDIVDVIRYK